MPSKKYDMALDLAADQYGYITTAQAHELGIGRDIIRKMAKRGTLERVSWGVYRMPPFPSSPYAEYMEASLWPAGVRGVVSHQSALAIRELSDVSPSKVHITVPRDFRIRRSIPAPLAVHHADLADNDVTIFEGIPATTVRRTLGDCHRTHLGPSILRQAIEDAEREGYLGPEDAGELQNLLTKGVTP